MIHVDEEEPSQELVSQFSHRKVNFKRGKDVRASYEMLCEIGRGKFGRVMKCRRKESGEIFAAKFVSCARREDRRNVEREVEIMNGLKSALILQLYEAWDSGRGEMCLITEYIGGGELFDRVIEEEFVLSERACCVFTKQILEGVAYIHRQGVIHLDLKPENILCLSKSGNRVKIIDLGLARKFEPMKKLQILFGTPEFVAPEVVNFEPIGYSTDMWALGVITYVLVSGLSPFMGDTDLETMANVTIAEYDYEDEAFDNVSQEAKDFIDSLLVKDQTRRATADCCLAHPWLQQIGTAPRTALLPTDNHAAQKSAWNNRDSNYYLFDSKSKTASQLYEMNISLSPRAAERLGDTLQEEENFSFFTPEGFARRDSEPAAPAATATADSGEVTAVRKRLLSEPGCGGAVETQQDSIEYVGLVKRPKTPLITAADIAGAAASLSERKQSGCGSLPDVISSSVDTTELHNSRCSLLESADLPADSAAPALIEEFPLPDILVEPDSGAAGDVTTLSEGEAGGSEAVTPVPGVPEVLELVSAETRLGDQVEVTEPVTPVPELLELVVPVGGLAKVYTVEEGFERPAGGWEDSSLPTVTEAGDGQQEDGPAGEEEDDVSSASSSLPSESSGIFYRAEYSPPANTPPVTLSLTTESRDSYWRNFQARGGAPGRRGSADCLAPPGSAPTNALVPISLSKSDAKISYTECKTDGGAGGGAGGGPLPPSHNELRTVQSTSFTAESDSELSLQEDQPNGCFSQSDVKNIEGQKNEQVVLPRTLKSPLKEEVFDKPWVEVLGDSPKQSSSKDNLSSTISQEMQDLLSSIQSLGKESASRRKTPVREEAATTVEDNLDFDHLMKEVENKIRFSVTAELLDRISKCPSIENYQEAEVEEGVRPGEYRGTPPIPDLLQPAVRPSPPLPRYTSLARPSQLGGAGNSWQPTGRVPDMLARVSCPPAPPIATPTRTSPAGLCADLSQVRSDIDSLCDIINTTQSDNAKPEYQDQVAVRTKHDQTRLSKHLAETKNVMKDIEVTVDSFRKQMSLPIGKVDGSYTDYSSSPTSKRNQFSTAAQGTVYKAKDRFELRSKEASRCTTPSSPFSSGTPRSPSPIIDPKRRNFSLPGGEVRSPARPRSGTSATSTLSLKKRSPSPVVTGKVSSFRSKFESTGCAVHGSGAVATLPRGCRALRHRDPAEIFSQGERRSSLSRNSSGLGRQFPLGRNTSAGRLPAHFVPIHNSDASYEETNKPKMNRAQSLRNPRYFPTPGDATTSAAANYLRSMLPKKMSEESKIRNPFGFNT